MGSSELHQREEATKETQNRRKGMEKVESDDAKNKVGKFSGGLGGGKTVEHLRVAKTKPDRGLLRDDVGRLKT